MQPYMGFQSLSGLPCRACLVDKIQVLRGGFRENGSELLHPKQFCDVESSCMSRKPVLVNIFRKAVLYSLLAV